MKIITPTPRWSEIIIDANKDMNGKSLTNINEIIANKLNAFNAKYDSDLDGVFEVSAIPSLTRDKITDLFNSPFWGLIPDRPSLFPPSPHTHTISEITDISKVSLTRDNITDFFSEPFWYNIPDKPTLYSWIKHQTSYDLDSFEQVSILFKAGHGFLVVYCLGDGSSDFEVKVTIDGGTPEYYVCDKQWTVPFVYNSSFEVVVWNPDVSGHVGYCPTLKFRGIEW